MRFRPFRRCGDDWRYSVAKPSGGRGPVRWAQRAGRIVLGPRFKFRSGHRAAVLAIGILGFAAVKLIESPWPADVTVRHWMSARNCDAARAVGLAPARWGDPGYWPSHDRDNDGSACEPWPGR
ncbi:MAG: excalibur calcium-binding domain-containing protein [Rhodospirillales bacterium]|nr:MAG: excalibur calcium-binding domain-containing protein [Rhodospirillales bacterium]